MRCYDYISSSSASLVPPPLSSPPALPLLLLLSAPPFITFFIKMVGLALDEFGDEEEDGDEAQPHSEGDVWLVVFVCESVLVESNEAVCIDSK